MDVMLPLPQAARGLVTSVAAATLAISGAVAADHDRNCDFALDGWLVAQMELEEAQTAFLACKEERKAGCKVERGRVRMLEQRVRLLRNYVDRHCRR
jgi:hypothetical protein